MVNCLLISSRRFHPTSPIPFRSTSNYHIKSLVDVGLRHRYCIHSLSDTISSSRYAFISTRRACVSTVADLSITKVRVGKQAAVYNDARVFQPGGGGVYSVGGSLSIALQLVQVRLELVLMSRIYRAVVAFGQSALLSSLSRHSAPRLYKPLTRAKDVFA